MKQKGAPDSPHGFGQLHDVDPHVSQYTEQVALVPFAVVRRLVPLLDKVAGDKAEEDAKRASHDEQMRRLPARQPPQRPRVAQVGEAEAKANDVPHRRHAPLPCVGRRLLPARDRVQDEGAPNGLQRVEGKVEQPEVEHGDPDGERVNPRADPGVPVAFEEGQEGHEEAGDAAAVGHEQGREADGGGGVADEAASAVEAAGGVRDGANDGLGY
jgi:hypothetical protein